MKRFFRFFESRIHPYPEQELNYRPQGLWQFIWACTKGSRLWLLMLTVFTGLLGAFEALLYSWMGEIVDWMTEYGLENFWEEKSDMLIIMVCVLFASIVLSLLNSGIHFQTLQGVFPMRLRWHFHKRILNQSIHFFSNEMSGRISAKVMQTALSVRETVMTFTSMVSYILVYIISSAIILANLDWLMLIPFLAWLVAFGCSMAFFLPRLREAATIQADTRSKMTGRITDAYANIATVKLFSHSQREQDFAREAMEEFMDTVHVQMRYVTGVETINHSINMLMAASTLALGLYLWSESMVSPGAVATATALALRVNGLSHWIMWQIASLFENMGTVQDGMNTLLRPIKLTDDKDAKTLTVKKGAIRFMNVDFAYNAQNPVFNNLSIDIKPGEKVGIVGRSGSGKSSFVNLLLRFYDVNSGEISIDGRNIQNLTQESLRAQIGMVTQDTSLLHRTIFENIAYGRPEASREEVIAAAKAAHAHEFIESLSDSMGNSGYDTLVGERGVKLSGGQRQRIAIARVMLKNAPILLLDEATSALDSEIEEFITQSLHQLMDDKTVVAIAHRLSTIASLDRLIVLDDGGIAEQGTHEQLIANEGIYAQLWRRQSGGFLAEE
ncbi:MAG: ABC transporter ATP-binding protein [Pseudomonadota bacterium]|nr:ABC transporter ATP-binding protein [Pseudomonadota bacterium]